MRPSPPRRRRRAAPPDVLFVCTANQCRSPIAEALLRDRLCEAGVAAAVRSAGLLHPGMPVPEIGVDLLSERGLDLSGHLSGQVNEGIVHHADLILGMATEHVREIVSAYPYAWSKAFVLKDFVRRAQGVSPWDPAEGIDDWLKRVGNGREPVDLVGPSGHDDIRDPIGRSEKVWRSVVDEIDAAVGDLAGLLLRRRTG